ncbi:LCP family protein [Solirubrobacter sp. CPCC 204708]|uniref:LCP family protein n=1 Tax=Solirubrobacter deserti TaxID=2282478 RepID=A0ABT4RI44_9ACTN|nr:LCP family protein [Solirubrobacter deserti]MBE2318802.1 LCP family protein [Solirubrobacter deserti]MDA0138182.1 LCP family protein [Solirubrobacter deserti]
MADSPDDKPPYTVYRSKPKLFRRRDDDGAVQPEPPAPQGWDEAPPPRRRRRLPFPRRRPGHRRRFGVWRLLRWLVTGVVAWLAISLVLFLISAQIQSASVSDAADAELGGAGYPLTSPNTVLVLGSDARTKDSKEPGANKIGEASRSDSILLLRIGGGSNATLSIPRDTVVEIPGHGQNKINAAYALGGPALAIRTVESYLGIPVNHLVEVNFENFPQLIDALGGVTYRGGCVVSRINGGFKNGGYTLRLKAGEQEIDGRQALALARTRKNECNPRESDLTRARRQQKIMNSIKDKVTSLETFIRLPWVSWAAPKAIRSDMSGPTLLGVVGAELSAGTAKPNVLKPTGTVTLPDGGAGLTVDEASKQRAVDRFLR